MNKAEITARQFYQAHQLWSMPEDVKKQLIILMLNTDSLHDEETDILPLYNNGELIERNIQAYNEAMEGKGKPFEDFIAETESKYSWLCD